MYSDSSSGKGTPASSSCASDSDSEGCLDITHVLLACTRCMNCSVCAPAQIYSLKSWLTPPQIMFATPHLHPILIFHILLAARRSRSAESASLGSFNGSFKNGSFCSFTWFLQYCLQEEAAGLPRLLLHVLPMKCLSLRPRLQVKVRLRPLVAFHLSFAVCISNQTNTYFAYSTHISRSNNSI